MISPMAMISLRDDIHTASVAQLWMIRIVRLKRRVKLNQYEKHGRAVLFFEPGELYFQVQHLNKKQFIRIFGIISLPQKIYPKENPYELLSS